MLGYTHFAIATTSTEVVLLLSGTSWDRAVPLVLAAGFSALLPDIDTPGSVAGRRSFGLSNLFEKVFKHRGMTHSVFGVLAWAAIVFPVGLGVWGSRALPFCIAAFFGYASHIYLGDIFTRTGVPITSRKKRCGLPSNPKRRIKTGSPAENTIFLVVVTLACVLGYAIYMGARVSAFYLSVSHPRGHFSAPAWLLPWTVFVFLAAVVLIVLLFWSRIHWRFRYAAKTITYKVSFNHHSEDLPLRSEQLGNLLHEVLLPSRIRLFTGQPHITVTYVSIEEKALLVSVPDVRHFRDLVKNALLDKLRGCRLEVFDFHIPPPSTRRRFGRIDTLRKSPAYSLRTLKGFETDDPLEALLNSMDVGPNSHSYIQLLLKPSSGSWKRSARSVREKIRTADDADMDKALKKSGILGVVAALFRTALSLVVSVFESLTLHPASNHTVAPAMNPYDGFRDRRREMSEETKDIVKSIDDKLNCRSSFLFEIRIIVEKEGATFHDIDRLATTFRQYDKHQGLVGKRIYWPSSILVDYLAQRNLWPLSKCAGILSSDELAGLLHNPYKNTVLVKVDMNTSRSAPAALDFTTTEGSRVSFGTNDHRGENDKVGVPWHDFAHHALVIGTTGSGKSTFLKSIFHQWLDSGEEDHPRGAIFIEPHGDACQELLYSIPRKHIERLYYIDPANTDYPLAFNPLAYANVFSADRTKDAIIAAFHAIWSLDPSMANLMLYLPRVTDVLARSKGAHFGWIRPFIINKDFRDQVLDELDDSDADQFWAHFSSKRQDRREEEVRSLLNRIDQFVLDRRLRSIFCQSEARVDFKSIIDEGKILICHFGDRNCGPIGKRLLGNLFCSYIHQAAQSRAEERRPFFVCMDECSEYLTPTIASILAQDRKFNIVFLAAFQYLAQTEELLAGLKGNTNTRVCFNVGEEDAVALAPLFASSSDPDEVRRRADDLMNLHRYQGFLKSTVNGRPLPPTTFNLPKPLTLMLSENRATVEADTRTDLCRDKEEVLAEQRAFAMRTSAIRRLPGGEREKAGAAELQRPLTKGGVQS